MHFCISE